MGAPTRWPTLQFHAVTALRKRLKPSPHPSKASPQGRSKLISAAHSLFAAPPLTLTGPARGNVVKEANLILFFFPPSSPCAATSPRGAADRAADRGRGEGKGKRGGREEEVGKGIDPESAPMMHTDMAPPPHCPLSPPPPPASPQTPPTND